MGNQMASEKKRLHYSLMRMESMRMILYAMLWHDKEVIMIKRMILDSISERIMYAHEDFIVYAEELESLGRKRSAEKLRDIINDLECLRYDLRNSNK